MWPIITYLIFTTAILNYREFNEMTSVTFRPFIWNSHR